VTDRQTDKQACCHCIVHAMHTCCTVKTVDSVQYN